MRSQCLRFESELDLARLKAQGRERFQRGQVAVPEREIQAASLALLRVHPTIAFAYRTNTRAGFVLNNGVYDRLVARGHMRREEARFIRFNFPGAADLTGMSRKGRRIEVECKAAAGVLSDEQRAFGEAVNASGGLWVCAYSVDELARALEGAE
jgi:hypothetical protein